MVFITCLQYLFESVNIMGDGENIIPQYIYKGIKDSPVYILGDFLFLCKCTGEFSRAKKDI